MDASFGKQINWGLIWIDASLVFAVWVCSYTISYISLDWDIVGTREAATNIPIWGLIAVITQISLFTVFRRYISHLGISVVNAIVRVVVAVVLTTIIFFVFRDAYEFAFLWVPDRAFKIYGLGVAILFCSTTLILKKRELIFSIPTALDLGLILLASISSILYIAFQGVITIVGLSASILCLSFSVREIFRPNKETTKPSKAVDCYALAIIVFGVALIIIAQDFEFFGFVVTAQGVAFFIRDNINRPEKMTKFVRHLESFSVTIVLLGVIFVVAEVILIYSAEKFDERADSSKTEPLTLPEEWKQKYVFVEGTKTAYYWHGKLHIQNDDRMRNIGEYIIEPEADRYVVLGDSLTYGLGISEWETYSALLQRRLETAFPTQTIVVYNLGVAGINSSQIVNIAKKFVPQLKPVRVMYGVCQNDVTDWYRDFSSETAWSIPSIISRSFASNTKIGQLMSDGYNRLLMQIGLRNDFLQDVLSNIAVLNKNLKDIDI